MPVFEFLKFDDFSPRYDIFILRKWQTSPKSARAKKVTITKLVVTGSIFKLFSHFKCLKCRGRPQLFKT